MPLLTKKKAAQESPAVGPCGGNSRGRQPGNLVACVYTLSRERMSELASRPKRNGLQTLHSMKDVRSASIIGAYIRVTTLLSRGLMIGSKSEMSLRTGSISGWARTRPPHVYACGVWESWHWIHSGVC